MEQVEPNDAGSDLLCTSAPIGVEGTSKAKVSSNLRHRRGSESLERDGEPLSRSNTSGLKAFTTTVLAPIRPRYRAYDRNEHETAV